MEQQIVLSMTLKDGAGNISVKAGDLTVDRLDWFKAEFERETGQFSFQARRLATDRAGQYFVDPVTGKTATEDCNLLSFLDPGYRTHAFLIKTLQEIEWACKNLHDTSFFNTDKMFALYHV